MNRSLLLFALTALLAAPALHAQSFELLGGYRTDTGEYVPLASPAGGDFAEYGYNTASADGQIVFGFIVGGEGEAQYVSVILDGDSVRVVNPDGDMLDYPSLPSGRLSQFGAISADGSKILGIEYVNDPLTPLDFAVWDWRTDEVLRFPVPQHNPLETVWLSADGSVVGAYFQYHDTQRYRDGVLEQTFPNFGALTMSEDGTAFGGWEMVSEQAAVATDAGITTYPVGGSQGSNLWGLNADGTAGVGGAVLMVGTDQIWRPILLQNGVVSVLSPVPDLPPSPFVEAAKLIDITRDGTLAWGKQDTIGGHHVDILWQGDGGMQKLYDALRDDYGLDLLGFVDVPGDTFDFYVHFMTADGVLFGEGKLGGQLHVQWRAVLAPTEVEEIVVTTTGDEPDADLDDGVCDADLSEPGEQCTLRAALEAANTRADRDSVSFAIEGGGPHQIALGSPLPALAEPLVLDATTQPGYAGTPLVSLTGGGDNGFELTVGQTTIRGFALGGYAGAGIAIEGPGGNVVEACHLGVDAAGAAAVPNNVGIGIDGSPDNRIGGTTAAQRNVISGNTVSGVVLTGEGATGNVVAGNYVGVSASGTAALGNGSAGIVLTDAPGNTIGGTEEGARNVIAANGQTDPAPGVLISGETASENVVAGNYVGTDATGAVALGNGAAGIMITDAPGNTIGGAVEGARNVIAANGFADDGTLPGVLISGETASESVIAGNYVGVDASGAVALGNAGEGLRVDGAPGTRIGGETVPERNVIAGNALHGVYVKGPGADGTLVQGNYIGVSADGAAALANGTSADEDEGHRGILVEYASDVVIGGPTATAGQPPGNVVSANAAHGILVVGYFAPVADAGPSDDLQVLGNVVGLDAAGQTLLSNGTHAVELRGAVGNARIGEPGGGNVIAGEAAEGEHMDGIGLVDLGFDGTPDSTSIAANRIGFTAAGDAVRGRMRYGIVTKPGAGVASPSVEGLRIGGSAEEGNQISSEAGVYLHASTGAVVGFNTVGLLASGELARPELDAVGIFALLADSVQIVGNTVGGQLFGILLGSNDGVVVGNFIGTNPAGTSARPNTFGLLLPGSVTSGGTVPTGSRNAIGGEGVGNVISGNTLAGLLIGGDFDANSDAREGGRAFGEAFGEAVREAAAVQTARVRGLGSLGASLHARAEAGAERQDGFSPDENVIAFNMIGTNAAGTAEIGNGRAATAEEAYAAVTISAGQANVLLGNIISGNGAGVNISITEDLDQPEGTVLAGNIVGLSASGTPLPNQYGGVYITQSNGNLLTALPLTEGGEPVGNVIAYNGRVGVGITNLGGEGHSNQVRQSSFLGNAGPSIVFFNGDAPDTTPPGVPEPPGMLSAVAGADQASLRAGPSATGPLDVFFSTSCNDGNAEGAYLLSVDATAGVVPTVLFDYDALGVSGAEEAVGLYLATTSTTTGETAATSAFSTCVRLTLPEDVAEALLPDGFTGDVPEMEEADLDVEVTDNPPGFAARGEARLTAGTLYAARHDLAPDHNTFDGIATAPDGSTVTPDTVAARYWTLATDDLGVLTYTACLDAAGLDASPEALVVVQRPNIGAAWTPYDSFLDGTTGRLCAAGLTGFGALGLGGGSPSDLTVTTEPVNPPIVIPPGGGPLSYDLSVSNSGTGSATFDYWIVITGAETHDPLRTPRVFTLAGGQTFMRTVTQRVPGAASAGSYTYTINVGSFPGTVLASDSFAFEKTAPSAGRAVGLEAGAPGDIASATSRARMDGVASTLRASPSEAWTSDWETGEWVVIDTVEDEVAAAADEAKADEEGATAEAPEASVEVESLPAEYALRSAYPNPFTAQATLRYDLPEAASVQVVVYDLLGREVARPVDGDIRAGRHTALLDGRRLASGVYLVRMTTGEHAFTQRLTLVR